MQPPQGVHGVPTKWRSTIGSGRGASVRRRVGLLSVRGGVREHEQPAGLRARMPTIFAGSPTCLWLHAPEPIPCDTKLTLWLRGPKTLRGVISERDAPTVNIEARFAVRIAGEYTLHVEDNTKRTLLSDTLRVSPGPAHTASCSLDNAAASTDGRSQVLRAADAQGNRHSVGGVAFQAAFGGDRCTVHDEGDGTYAISLPTRAPSGPGQLQLWQPVTADSKVDAAVIELPIFVRRPPVKPPARATCTLLDTSTPVFAGRALKFGLELFDERGAPACARNPAVQLHARLGKQPVHLAVDPPPIPATEATVLSRLTAHVTPATTGTFTFTAYCMPSGSASAGAGAGVSAAGGGDIPAGATLLCSLPLQVKAPSAASNLTPTPDPNTRPQHPTPTPDPNRCR